MPALTSVLTHGRIAALLSVAAFAVTPFCTAADAPFKSTLNTIYPSLDALYQDLHRNPELSLQEEKTAAKMAAQLRKLGLQVTERVGGHGVVGVLRNGDGPTVMVRTDMDALPIKEQTGLPYASNVAVKGANGDTTSVMHACGHDIHMTSWVGAAAILAANKQDGAGPWSSSGSRPKRSCKAPRRC